MLIELNISSILCNSMNCRNVMVSYSNCSEFTSLNGRVYKTGCLAKAGEFLHYFEFDCF